VSRISQFISPIVMCMAAIGAVGTARAQDAGFGPAASAVRLDAIRGGVDLGGGLLSSFGIARATYINGQLVAHSEVTIPDIAHVTASQATALAAALQTVVVRNGPGNFADPASFSGAAAATVIQNTLDAQNIQNLTTIRASVDTLADFNLLRLQEGLQAGLVQSLGH